MGWTDDPDKWIKNGLELAEKAVDWAPEEPGGYQMLGMLALSQAILIVQSTFVRRRFSLLRMIFLFFGDSAVFCTRRVNPGEL